ncbi:hypothetical protein F3J44_23555 [Pantoea sp. Tr-811]|nr:hypothetical protein [Pantoea sp. Ap-967]NIF29331.1 hypothetical protein [Pantoea sp. Tr-811]
MTNSEWDKGFLPVPIIRNEHWFEKFYSSHTIFTVRPLPSKTCKTQQSAKKTPRMRGFPFIEHSGYAT